MNALTQKPFQLILMAVFGLLALLGLYVFATYTGFGGSGQKIGTVVIWGTLPADAINQEIGTLSSGNKLFGKVTYVQKQVGSFDNDLANAIASGNGPDMILISQEQLLTEENKIQMIPFTSIPQRTYIDTYLPEFHLFLTSNGSYGIPFVLDPMVLYYNRTLLSQAGVATPPRSWEAVTGLAPTLTRISADHSVAQSAIALGSYGNIENARGMLSLLFLQAGSAITSMSSGSLRSTLAAPAAQSSTEITPNAVSPAESALNFYTQFSDPSRTVYSWNTGFSSARQAFLAGTVALYPGFASEEPALKAANPNLPFDMAGIPQPQTAAVRTDYGLAYAFAIPKASHNTPGAYLTARALSANDLLPSVAQALFVAPANRTLLVASPSDQYAPVYYPQALIATGWLSPAPPVTDSLFSTMITNITSGRYQTHNALYTADQALTAALPSL
jgi:ABC-type glycerol-3-phosphate transport system substrate-binding protein